uniref:hypothetical protein n=1 Tax=Paractinoplanes polyasparticus TaxID=2856853 RepID=UPI001C863C5E|nr:hypothetical protein [Actinoplanes polyasparticus]
MLRFVPAGLIDEAIDVIAGHHNHYHRGHVLGTIVPNVPVAHHARALGHLLPDNADVAGRRALLTQGSRIWGERVGPAELELLRRCLEGFDLDDCLSTLSVATGIVRSVGGPQVADDLLDAIDAVQRWWPRLTEAAN